MLENLWRMQEILILQILGLNSCIWKSYHHIFMHFVPQFQCFELFLNVFSKTVFFLKFSEPLPVSIDPFYFSINRNFFKIVLTSLCLFRSIETVFRSIETRESVFFKNSDLTCSNYFFKTFSTFLSLSDLARLHWDFLSFSANLFARFFSP